MTKNQQPRDKPPLWETAYAEDLPEDHLNAVLEFYEENLVLKTFNRAAITVRHLSPQEVARALSNESCVTTGLLTPDTLWWRHDATGPATAIWREPQVWSAALQMEPFEPPRRFKLPMPGLIFITKPGSTPSVFTSPERPTNPDQMLYNMPTFNVFSSGRICPGNHNFPLQPSRVPESFFESFFTLTGDHHSRSRKHQNDILSLWEEIDGQPDYPTEDLVEAISVSTAIERPRPN